MENLNNKNTETKTNNNRFRTEKEFQSRNSPLTDKYKLEDFKTIYNFFVIILINLFLNSVVYDYINTGELHFGLRLFIYGFNKFYLVLLIWCCLFIINFFVYTCFQIWARNRIIIKPIHLHKWDRIWLVILVFYYILSLYSIQKITQIFAFHPGSTAILFLEELRQLMKQHSFIRRTAPKVMHYKIHSDKKLILPSIYQFLYFFFAPTFLYRDKYPRTNKIRWKFVIFNIAEVIGVTFLLGLIVETLLIPYYKDFGLRKYRKSEIIAPLLLNIFPGFLFFMCGFYSVLHSCQNAFAEILKFGDREFYNVWWTCRSLSEWYRSYNIIVYEWIHTYLYKDMYQIVLPGNKLAAKFTVFTISAIIHEWVISNILNLFMPIQSTQFLIGGAFLSLLDMLHCRVGNLIVWYCIILGSGIQVNMYTLEYYARKNCPLPQNDTGVFEFFKPRFLTCDCFV